MGNVSVLDAFDSGATVDMEMILERGLASKTAPLLKLLGDGEITKSLTVRAHKFSATAKAKIEKAGGTVVVIGSGDDTAEAQG